MKRFAKLGVILLTLFASAAPRAEPASPPVTAAVVQRVGGALPLDVRLADEKGREVALRRFFDDVPVVLVFGYYRCPTLCTTFMESVLLGLSASGVAPRSYRILGVSIDPRETSLDAARKAAAYRDSFGTLPLTLLTGSEGATHRLAKAAGVSYSFDRRYDEYEHPIGFMVVSATGRISRYFPGIGFDSQDLRLALVEASQSTLGSLSERIFLRCAHYDPATGRYTLAVMSAIRAICGILIVALALCMWRRRKGA